MLYSKGPEGVADKIHQKRCKAESCQWQKCQIKVLPDLNIAQKYAYR